MSRSLRQVIVGFDGSVQAGVAVEWAAGEAARRRSPLHIVCVTDHSRVVEVDAQAAAWLPGPALTRSRQLAEQAAEQARKVEPELRVDTEVLLGHAAAILIEASRRASVLVVGANGHGSVAGSALGSVAFEVAAHGHAPVVVVRGAAETDRGSGRPVVVGVDDSANCRSAVTFAGDLAEQLQAPLTVACAWSPVSASGTGEAYWTEAAPTLDPDLLASQAAAETARSAADIVSAAHPRLRIRAVAIPGPAARRLALISDEAAAVVVGARGRGGFAGMLLGSVSRELTLTARCPVAVVRRQHA
jgi:nucleotide-binding universal stress UspA family protein